ncbi:MAG: HAD hydrolase-like protein [Lysobacterales bacterium]
MHDMTSQGTVFFDLDGTLTDPQEGIVNCIVHALEKLDVPRPDRHRLTRCIGPPLQESFVELVGPERAELAVQLYRQRFDACGWQENRRYPGILEGLQKLSERGVQLCVATSKPQIFAERIVEHFDMQPYFQHIFGPGLDGTRADKSELLAFAVAQTHPSRPIAMVGDRKHDMIGAGSNAIPAIGVTYGFGSAQELRTAGAQDIVDSVSTLFVALDDLLPES